MGYNYHFLDNIIARLEGNFYMEEPIASSVRGCISSFSPYSNKMSSASQGIHYANEVMDKGRENSEKPIWFILERDHMKWIPSLRGIFEAPCIPFPIPFPSPTHKGKRHLNTLTIYAFIPKSTFFSLAYFEHQVNEIRLYVPFCCVLCILPSQLLRFFHVARVPSFSLSWRILLRVSCTFSLFIPLSTDILVVSSICFIYDTSVNHLACESWCTHIGITSRLTSGTRIAESFRMHIFGYASYYHLLINYSEKRAKISHSNDKIKIIFSCSSDFGFMALN